MVLSASVLACGGRTDVLRERSQSRIDAGVTGDAGQPADAGPSADASQPNQDAGPGCNEVLSIEPFAVQQPEDPFSFKALVDGDFIYAQDRNGSQTEITRTRLSEPGRPDLMITPTAQLADVRGGRLLFNALDVTDGRSKASVYQDGLRPAFLGSAIVLPQQFGFEPHAQLVHPNRIAWMAQMNTMRIYDPVNNTGNDLAFNVTAMAVGASRMAWSNRPNELVIEAYAGGTLAVPLPSFGPVETLVVAPNVIAGLVATEPFVWRPAHQGEARRPAGVPADGCIFVVASDWGAVFVCSEDEGQTTFAYALNGETTSVLPTGRSVVVAVSMFDEFFSYIAFPAGENFCQGGTEGRVKLFDLNQNQTYDLGAVTSPCGCCGRISAFPRTHVRDNVVLWHGESQSPSMFGFEFGAARIERRCE